MTGLILIINRIFDIFSPNYSHALFSGSKTYIWLAFPSIYMFYFLFCTKPFLFNSLLGAVFLDPYAGLPGFNTDLALVKSFSVHFIK